MNQNPEQQGEPAEASGLPFGTPNPANVTDADKDVPAPEAAETATSRSTSERPGVDTPAQGTDGTSPPSYTGESGDNADDPEQIRRSENYDRPPE